MLSGHSNTVKAVKFLPQIPGDSFSYLVTGADDQCLKLWKLDLAGSKGECVQTAQEHTAPINCIAALPPSLQPSRRCIFASGAADATIKIWEFDSGSIKLLQTIKTTPKYFPLAAALSPLGGGEDAFVLAAAGTSGKVQIFVTEPAEKGLEFKLQATLPGHEGWIRSLDFVPETADTGSDLLLASASQDKYIRLWRFRQGRGSSTSLDGGGVSSLGALLPGTSPSNKAYRLKTGANDSTVTFEALLLGHEDWIYSAKWHRRADGNLHLLSASADNSLSIWQADAASGIWVTSARLGEISREKGATTATGSTGGFWTGLWSPDGDSVATLGRTGSWRLWSYSGEEDRWAQNVAVSGHTRAVTGISWARNGGYLLSTSADQTTRLHGKWKGGGGSWRELSRPQIHGYDLNCIDALSDTTFVSGADEKLMRVFSEPKAVAKLLHRLTGAVDATIVDSLPDAANVPSLGLSNKAVDAADDGDDVATGLNGDHDGPDPATAVRKAALDMDHPPFEETLSRNTLWPEVEKLYGHGYEISCLATSHDGRIVASACRASSVNHAVIRLFETARWTELKPPLAAHTLTATRLRFSPDDRYLLSVGRDRQWAVFERRSGADSSEGENEDLRYTSSQADPKGHTRMILDAAWAPLQGETRVFATAGRDKQVKIWVKRSSGDEAAKFGLEKAVAHEHAVTAIDFLSRPSGKGNLVLATGTEAGKIRILSLQVGEDVTVASSLDLSPE